MPTDLVCDGREGTNLSVHEVRVSTLSLQKLFVSSFFDHLKGVGRIKKEHEARNNLARVISGRENNDEVTC